jgi:hypothetical protein
MSLPIAERIEVKLAFVPQDTSKAFAALGFDAPGDTHAPKRHKPDQERTIHFFDTHGLALLEMGLILRARHTIVGDDPDDATLKVRGERAPDAANRFLTIAGGGAKFEGDQNVGKHELPSFSITTEPGAVAVAAVRAGNQPFKSLLNSAGKKLLKELVKTLGSGNLQRLGPIRSQIWKWTPNGLGGKITAELWEVAGQQLLEISDKAPRSRASELAQQFKTLVPDSKARQLDGSKTGFALKLLDTHP